MKKLCVVFGGASVEHDISIITGMQLAKEIKSKYEVEKIYLSLNNKFFLATKVDNLQFFENKKNIKLKEVCFYDGAIYTNSQLRKKLFEVDCVINCCHGGVGECGDLAGYFATVGVKTTSADALASHIAMDKFLTKELVKDIVPTIDGVKITKSNYADATELVKNLKDDLIVKPNSLGSSIGVMAKTKKNFLKQIDAIFELNDCALVENRIKNIVEYNQACFKDNDNLVLSAIEQPISKQDFLTFDEKYNNLSKQKGGDRIIPAKISLELTNKISSYTKLIYERTNMNGVVRIDYIFDVDESKLYFNEINTIPGSMAYYLYEPIGVDYITLVEKLIKNAHGNKKYSYFDSGVLIKKLL